MRELVLEEAKEVGGGSGGVVLACAATAVMIGIIGSYLCTPYRVRYEPYIETTNVVTPIYDAHGKHVANKTDTFEETKYKPIYY